MDPDQPAPAAPGSAPSDDAALLSTLGVLLLDAGLSVTDVRTELIATRDACATEAMSFAVLPEAILIGRNDRGGAAVVRASPPDPLTTRQAARAMMLLRDLQRGILSLRAAPDAIGTIRREVSAHPALAWTIGSALVSVGLAVLFRCPWWAVLTAAVGGAAVGALSRLLSRVPSAAAIVPFVAAFASTLLVGLTTAALGAGPVPLYAVCAPIAILVPGALITNALLELTAADIVTGSARLAYGLITLGFMAAGIAAGAALTGLRVDPASAVLVGHPVSLPAVSGGWTSLPPSGVAWAGVAALGWGIGMAFGAGPSLTVVGVGVMLGTYALLGALTPLTGSTVATGATAAVLFLFARMLERVRTGIPASITFQPAFLLLVPGSVGLVALSSGDAHAVSTAAVTFAALCIGTKLGSFLTDVRPGRRQRAAAAPASDTASTDLDRTPLREDDQR